MTANYALQRKVFFDHRVHVGSKTVKVKRRRNLVDGVMIEVVMRADAIIGFNFFHFEVHSRIGIAHDGNTPFDKKSGMPEKLYFHSSPVIICLPHTLVLIPEDMRK